MSSFHILRSLIAIFPFIKARGSACWIFIKGLLKDPFFVKITSGTLILFGILVFSSNLTAETLQKRDFSFLSAHAADKFTSLSAFLEFPKNLFNANPEMVFIQKNSLVGVSSPANVSNQTLGTLAEEYSDDRKEIIEYETEPGDTLSSVAQKFNISLNTILWANNLSKGSTLKTGQKLIVLPVSGVVHDVKKGDTLVQVAKLYKSGAEDIISFNNLSDEGDIFVGDILVVPNGVMPAKPQPVASQIPLGSSYFICPNASCNITQGLHWYNAIDFKGSCGDPVFAAAAGKVQRVKYGWNQGGGNTVTILHPNGVVTTYGHVSASLANPGQDVSQGDIIALVGGKPGTPGAGISTGCHVHFGVIGARNPFAR